jgi:hypothetical protein
MLLKFIWTIIILFTCAQSNAQVNLVMNPSLEQYSNCPSAWDEIKYADYWTSLDTTWNPLDWVHDPTGVPDYCNICAGSNPFVGIPNTPNYHHYPRTGSGMAEVIMFYDEIDTGYSRDYLEGNLNGTLTLGKSYCVSFYITLEQGSTYAINHIGAFLDDGTIDSTHRYGRPQSQYSPQILQTTIISDTLNWVKVQGSFVASGKEKYITIGNFSDKTHTSYIPAPGVDTTGIYAGDVGGYSYYLVDDISVIASETVANAGSDKHISIGDSVLIGTNDGYLPTYWYAHGTVIDSNTAGFYVHPTTTMTYVMSLDVCGTITYDTITVYVGPLSLSNIQKAEDVVMYPNPATDDITIEHAKGDKFMLSDMVGRTVRTVILASDKETLNISYLQKGLYVGEVIDLPTRVKTTMKIIKE